MTKAGSGERLPRPFGLYWCTTDDHDEDWFMVARYRHQAARLFAGYEGYDHDMVTARRVLTLPASLQHPKSFGWPTRELLEGCGAVIRRWETPRVVELAGRLYSEGMLESLILERTDDQFERLGRGRPNRTTRGEVS